MPPDSRKDSSSGMSAAGESAAATATAISMASRSANYGDEDNPPEPKDMDSSGGARTSMSASAPSMSSNNNAAEGKAMETSDARNDNLWPSALEAVMRAVELRDAASAAASGAAAAPEKSDSIDAHNTNPNKSSKRPENIGETEVAKKARLSPTDDDEEHIDTANNTSSSSSSSSHSQKRLFWDRFSRVMTDQKKSSTLSAAQNVKSCCKEAFHGRPCSCTSTQNAIPTKVSTSKIASAKMCCSNALLLGQCSCNDNAAKSSNADTATTSTNTTATATTSSMGPDAAGGSSGFWDASKSTSKSDDGSWKCDICSVRNANTDVKCQACGTGMPDDNGTTTSSSNTSKKSAEKPTTIFYATKPTPPPHIIGQQQQNSSSFGLLSASAASASASMNAVASMMSSSAAALSASVLRGRRNHYGRGYAGPSRAYDPHNNQRTDAITMHYEAPDQKVLPPGLECVAAGSRPDGPSLPSSDSVCVRLSSDQIEQAVAAEETCKICLDSLASKSGKNNASAISIKLCGHKFHLGCIRQAMRHQTSPKCPECRTVVLPEALIPGRLQGNMPSGTMTIQRYPYYSCQGYEGDGSITITYRINSGTQKPYHPHPGRRHGSAYRTAYLPDNQEGRDLLCRLQFAFLHGLTFTVGKSLTSGVDDAVTWASIHHKTSRFDGAQAHGYPDVQYLSNCNAELDAVGVPSLEACAVYVKAYKPPHPMVVAANNTIGMGRRLSSNQMLLYFLLHASHCTHDASQHGGTPCSIVERCQDFKDLRRHTEGCTDTECTFQYCVEAKAVLAHYATKTCSIGNQAGSCRDCGLVRAGFEGAKQLGDDVGKMGLRDLHNAAKLHRHATMNHNATFCFERNVQSVFSVGVGASNGTTLSLLENKIMSSDFLDFAHHHGVEGGSVEMNPFLSVDSDLYKEFMSEGKKCVAERTNGDATEENREAAKSELCVRIVFHGTHEKNIESILSNGLDPQMRSGQAYGQGEYYASSPAMPVGYCQGGKKMLVFAVISAQTDIRTKEVVVVRKSERQLPIATLSFEHVSRSGMEVADYFQHTLKALKDEKEKKATIAQEAREKEKIEKLLFRQEYLAASDFYKGACSRNGGVPPSSWAEELAIYVRDHIRDDEEVDIYFPNLPPRPSDSQAVDILNVDECDASAQAAKDQLEAYQKKMGRK